MSGRLATVQVAVVGGGLAGWTAARRAQELGARVVLVERSPRLPGWGNSLISGGALHAVMRDPLTTSAEELVAELERRTDGSCSSEVARAWAANASRAVQWIRSHGGEVGSDPPGEHRAAVFKPAKASVPGLRWRRFGVHRYLSGLRDAFLAAGGEVRAGCRAVGLRRQRASWLLSLQGRGDLRGGGEAALRARGVVLADGGFQANRSLLRRYVGTDHVKLRAAGTGTGDGLRMGLSVGAATVNMRSFYGHLLVREALSEDSLWPYPILDSLSEVGLVVDSRGRRFVDEAQGGITVANEIAWSASPLDCWVVFDDEAWNGPGRAGTTPANPYLPEHGGTLVSAPSLEEVARRAGIDPARLRASASAGGAGPRRSGELRLRKPPFHAIPLVVGVTFTQGGLVVDGHTRVLSEEREPLGGLFAAGGTAGGLHGGPRAGYAGGLLEAAVFGLIAGEASAGFLRD